MIDLLKKSLLAGIGIASLTKERIEEIASELKTKGELSEEEGKKFVSELLKQAETSRLDLQKTIEERVDAVLTRCNFARKSEVDELRAAVEKLLDHIENDEKPEDTQE